jgi:hypothetical protein
MVSPTQKRRAASSVVAAQRCSGRQACRYLGLGRSTWHYDPLPPTSRQIQLEKAILDLSHAHHPAWPRRPSRLRSFRKRRADILERFSKRAKERDAAIANREAELGRELSHDEIAILVRETRAKKQYELTPEEVRQRQLATREKSHLKHLGPPF